MNPPLLYSLLLNAQGKLLSPPKLHPNVTGLGTSLDETSFLTLLSGSSAAKIKRALRFCKGEEAVVTLLLRLEEKTGCRSVQGRLTQIAGEKELYQLELWASITDTSLPGLENGLSKSLFEQFMKHSPLMGWITDEAGVMQYMNPVFLENYQFTQGDVGKTVFALYPKELAHVYVTNNQLVLDQNRAIETLERGFKADGQEQILKICKFPLPLEGQRLIAGWAMDISDEVAVQEALRKHVERYYYVNRATSDAIYDWDLLKKAVYRGSGFQTLFGYANLHGSIRFNWHHIHPEDRRAVLAEIFAALRKPEVNRWQVEYRFREVTGHYKWVIEKAYIIREEGRAVRIISALQDVSDQRQLQTRLMQQEKAHRQNVVRSIINAQERERKQVAVELHDNVNQILASCKLLLDVAQTNPELAPALTQRVSLQLQAAMTEIRSISHNLNPHALADMGLLEAVQLLIGDVNVSGRLQVSFSYSGDVEGANLVEEDRVAIYRILQESIANILKHARAPTAAIELHLSNCRLHMLIQDDGVGFDAEVVKKGMGLKNIQNRVDYYGGVFQLQTAPGAGCRIEIDMLLHPFKKAVKKRVFQKKKSTIPEKLGK